MRVLFLTAIVAACLVSSGFATLNKLESERIRLHHKNVGAAISKLLTGFEAYADTRRASPGLAQNPKERYRASWLYSLRYTRRLQLRTDRFPGDFTVNELIFNTRHSKLPGGGPSPLPWTLLKTEYYDQLPTPILEVVLKRQMEQFESYARSFYWPEVSLEKWRTIPEPIQKITAFRSVWQWAWQRYPQRYGLSHAEAARILVSIGMVESLFDLDRTRNYNPETGNEDRGYFQISDSVRVSLSRLDEFRAYETGDYYHPWVSIQAASYHFFHFLMDQAAGNPLRAIGMYNAGPRGEKKRAESYLLAVADRYMDTFMEREHYSPTRCLMLQYANSDYFSDVESDHLYEYVKAKGLHGSS